MVKGLQEGQRQKVSCPNIPKHALLPSDHIGRCSARSTHPRLLLRVYSARLEAGWSLCVSQETCHIQPHPRARLPSTPSTNLPLDHEGTNLPHDAHDTTTAHRSRCCISVLTVSAFVIREDEAAKKAEAARKKAERDALLAEEEKNTPGRSAPKNAKSAQKKTRGLDLDQFDVGEPSGDRKLATLNASGLNNALDALEITNSDNKAKIDRHPERRVAAAKNAWLEALEKQWESEGVLKEKKKYRGAYNDELRKLWKKAPENPMNQVSAAYNATQEEMAELRAQEKDKVENRLAEK